MLSYHGLSHFAWSGVAGAQDLPLPLAVQPDCLRRASVSLANVCRNYFFCITVACGGGLDLVLTAA